MWVPAPHQRWGELQEGTAPRRGGGGRADQSPAGNLRAGDTCSPGINTVLGPEYLRHPNPEKMFYTKTEMASLAGRVASSHARNGLSGTEKLNFFDLI